MLIVTMVVALGYVANEMIAPLSEDPSRLLVSSRYLDEIRLTSGIDAGQDLVIGVFIIEAGGISSKVIYVVERHQRSCVGRWSGNRQGADLTDTAAPAHVLAHRIAMLSRHRGVTPMYEERNPSQVDRPFVRGGFARLDSLLRFLSGTSEAIMLPI
ncbi:hypothetical protein, partial [Burkholderia pseudomallei]|uniref:hypothetical protein n=1 Tax=Burkholderia pseudomallei TaxID=28450 RepID=UPI0011788941